MGNKLIIDFGASNMKIVGDTGGDIAKTKIIKSLAVENALRLSDRETVKYNGKEVTFGVGKPLITLKKTDRSYITESILFGAYHMFGAKKKKSIEIDFAMGLPINEYIYCDTYEKELREKYINKPLSGVVNNEKITVNIKSLRIYAEGLSGYLSVKNAIDKSMEEDTVKSNKFLVIDIGYSTTDVIGIKDGKLDATFTYKIGIQDVIVDICKAFNGINKVNYGLDVIEDAIINKLPIRVATNTGAIYKDIMEYYSDGKEPVERLFKLIENEQVPDLQKRTIYLIGGGAYIVNFLIAYINKFNEGKKDSYLDVRKLPDDKTSIFANATGYLYQLENDLIKSGEKEEDFIEQEA